MFASGWYTTTYNILIVLSFAIQQLTVYGNFYLKFLIRAVRQKYSKICVKWFRIKGWKRTPMSWNYLKLMFCSVQCQARVCLIAAAAWMPAWGHWHWIEAHFRSLQNICNIFAEYLKTFCKIFVKIFAEYLRALTSVCSIIKCAPVQKFKPR